jgi:asparagine synthase (glutamine-hydrolysing)
MNMRLTEEHLSYKTAGNLLPKLVWHLDEPLADSAIIPCYLVAREAAKRVKVILNGTGGDEIFGGYPRYNVRGLLPGAFSLCLGSALSLASRANEGLHRFCGLLDYRRRYMRHLSVFPEQHVRSALGLKGPGSVDRFVRGLFSESSRRDPAGSMMHVDLNLYLPGDLFMMLDKMTMAVSLEARVPLLDHRLVEFMATIPGSIKMHGNELKWLLRRSLRGAVPDQILDRPKQGFGPPIATWMQGPFGAASRKLLARKDAGIWNILQNDGLHSWSHPISGISKQEAGRLWSLLVLELWWRSFVNNQDLSDLGVEELAMGGG